MEDGRIAYVDFGNVAQLSQYNKQILVDAVVHAVNEDYVEMASDFIKLGFLAKGGLMMIQHLLVISTTGNETVDLQARTQHQSFLHWRKSGKIPWARAWLCSTSEQSRPNSTNWFISIRSVSQRGSAWSFGKEHHPAIVF